jgi:DNA-directed RNA polymerase specialized sigma24 family protein
VEDWIGPLVERADRGERGAADALFALLYDELHRLAEHHLRRAGPSGGLGATTLLHEAYLNVSGREGVAFADRSRFLSYASRAMRGLLIDFARRRGAVKRGSALEVTLGDALAELAAVDPPLAELVDLHFFCGFAFAEIAALRGVSDRTVRRDWRKARLLLHHALLDAEDEPG